MPRPQSRRQFLRRTAAAVLAAPAIWRGSALGRGEPPGAKIDIAIVGTGGRGAASRP